MTRTIYSRSAFPYVLLLLAASFLPSEAGAQNHFTDCATQTGDGATLIIPAEIGPTIDGRPLSNGDEIAVYTPRGTCAGAGLWDGSNLAISIWGDDVITADATEGFQSGETLSFRIWDASASAEIGDEPADVTVGYAAEPPHNVSGSYATDGIYLLTSLQASTTTSVDLPDPNDVPSTYHLAPSYPNPFNPSTMIRYDLADAGPTTLIVYDMLGRQVRVLVDEDQEAGRYEIQFDASNLPSGNYIYRLRSGRFTDYGTMVLSK